MTPSGGARSRPPGPGSGFAGWIRALAFAVLALWSGAGGAAGQIELAKGEGFRLGLAGTLQSLTGFAEPASSAVGSETVGVHGAVLRLKWMAEWDGWGVLEIHDRVLARVTSSGIGAAAGFGVTRRPGRAVDLTTRWVDEDGAALLHDLDRLAVTLYTRWADVTVGRQAVSWGTATLFPVADLWASFSPFELDVEERPGVDGIRVLTYPGGVEVDAVAVDRGFEGTSVGVRGSWSGSRWELWAGAGRFWESTLGFLGATRLGDRFKVRAEIAAGDVTRATLGLDRVATRFSFSVEVHYNGTGAEDTDGYPRVLASPEFAHGETYFLGRLYAGLAGAWRPDDEARWSLSLSGLGNLMDGSTVWMPAASYDLGRSVRVGLGAVSSTGAPPLGGPTGSPLPSLPTEFGATGRQLHLRVALFF